MGYRDELVDLCLSPGKEGRLYRAVMNKDVTSYLEQIAVKLNLKQGGRIVCYSWGEANSGKSWLNIGLALMTLEELQRLGIEAELVWSKSYVQTVQRVREAAAKGVVAIILQDEHPKVGGQGAKTELDDFDNCVSQLRKMRYCYFIACTRPPPNFSDLSFSIHVVGHNKGMVGASKQEISRHLAERIDKLQDYDEAKVEMIKAFGAALGVYCYRSGRQKGYVIVYKNPKYPHTYEYYENEVKDKRQAEVSATGGAESALNNAETLEFAQKACEKLIELEPCTPKVKVEMIDAAIDACGAKAPTYGVKKGSLYYNVKKLYEEYQAKTGNIRPTSKPKQSTDYKKPMKAEKRTMGREAVEEGDKWEAECIEKYMPKLFREHIITGRKGGNLTGKKLKGQPDLLGIAPTELLRRYVNLDTVDHLRIFVALEHGNHPDVDQYTVSIREEGNNKIEREVFAARLFRNTGENIALLLMYKETGRNQVYFHLIDIDEPRSHTIHFDTDKNLQF